MAINSKIILAKGIRLDKDYKNVVNYNESQMLTLLRDSSHLIYEANNYSFIDEFQNIINVQVPYGACIDLNYMAYQNPRYDNKWFFCFIDRVEYNSEKSTNIAFHVDSWSTWWNSLTQNNCYVIREHVADDTIGKHTLDEGLDIGDVVCEGYTIDTLLNANHYIAVTSNWDPAGKLGFTEVAMYNRGIWGSMVVLFPLTTTGIDNLKWFILQTNADGHPEDIHDIFILPDRVVKTQGLSTKTYNVYIGETLVHSNATYDYINTSNITTDDFSPETNNITITKQHSFTGVNVHNNKCYCYPYNYILVTNNAGNQNTYKYEDFSTTSCVFEQQFALAIGCSGRTVPKNYKGIVENVDESLPCSKYPTCQWSSDSYTNWLTQNAVNNKKDVVNFGFSAASGMGNVIGNALIGNVVGAIGSTFNMAQDLTNQVLDMEGKFYSAKLLPNLVGGSPDGDVNFASLDTGFKYLCMRAKNEYMLIIDDFFSRFGYKILRVKTPEMTSRTYWNYIQIGAGESFGRGNIPQNDLEIINSIAQKGFTIWHNHNNIGNYTLINSIVS